MLNEDALHGLAGEVVRAIEPYTESDPVALLMQFIAYFGNIIGRDPMEGSAYYVVEADKHYPNLFVVLVGETSKSRKGTSAGRIRDIMMAVDSDWVSGCTANGLSSGEGVIWRCDVPDSHKQKQEDGRLPSEPECDCRKNNDPHASKARKQHSAHSRALLACHAAAAISDNSAAPAEHARLKGPRASVRMIHVDRGSPTMRQTASCAER
jgi:hypothetical protein